LLAGALAAMVFSAAQGLAHGFGFLFPVRFFTVLAAGFLEPTLNAMLAKRAPGDMQGRVFGWASATRSFGWALGPLAAGAVAAKCLRGVFFSAGIGYAVLALLAWCGARRGRGAKAGGDGTGGREKIFGKRGT
jgi:MFS family permease